MSEVNYANDYIRIIETEKRTPRAKMAPNNIYKISVYKYASGDKKRLSGEDSTFIFVTGIFNETVYGLKLTHLKPDTFLRWASRIVKNKKILSESEEKLIYFSDIAPPMDRAGKRLYDGYIKNNSLLKSPNIPYRAYKLDGIKHVSEVFIMKDILKLYYE